jgi:hypothetical protein
LFDKGQMISRADLCRAACIIVTDGTDSRRDKPGLPVGAVSA